MADLSLTGRKWVLPKSTMTGESLVKRLLSQRGLTALGDGELLDSFGHDARQFRDFAKVRERILHAVQRQEVVGIFGDYDCDGITATALLARFFHRRNMRPVLRLPHRVREGYGLSSVAVRELSERGVRLLLTVDTGVTALESIAEANALGMDVIVTDHHTLPLALPPAFAILHPAFADPRFDSAPCGAGVAWSLVHAMEELEGNAGWDDEETDIALAAIGTVADVVELRGGNRTLVHSGLMALRRLRPGPLSLLCLQAGLESPYTSKDVAFRIAPRINAAGRMADPHIALQAILGDPMALLQLEELNRARQDVVSAHLAQLLPQPEQDAGMLCFVHDEYSPGICGLLASRLTEMYGKPSLVAGRHDEICTASLRSIPGYDVTAGLASCADLLRSFGGHAMAAGCTFASENFDALRARLDADVRLCMAGTDLTPALAVECSLDIGELTMQLCHELRVLEPFGQGNPEPRFLVRDVLLEGTRCVGKDGKHLQATARGRKLIGFSLGHLHAHAAQPLDLVCRIGIDTWQGNLKPQLFVDDMRVAEKAKYQVPNTK